MCHVSAVSASTWFTVPGVAYIRKREKSDGTVSFAVRGRAGGARGGKQEAEILEDSDVARRFRDLVGALAAAGLRALTAIRKGRAEERS